MRIETYELPPIGTNAFLLVDEERGEAVLIDAPGQAWETVALILERENLKLTALLLTHGHFDHVLGAAAFNDAGIPVYAHPADREMLARLPEQMAMFGIPGKVVAPQVDHWLEAGQSLNLLGRSFEVKHTPGHCPGNVTFYLPNEKAAFVGDVIFAGGIGRTDFPGCSFELLEKSIREEIYTLPEDTTLFPGHGPNTTVGHERTENPFVSG